jgi:hypothetical protein
MWVDNFNVQEKTLATQPLQHEILKKILRGLSPRANYTDSDRHMSAKLLPTFADRGCHVVSVTDPSGRILIF